MSESDDGKTPDYYKQTTDADGHPVTAIEGSGITKKLLWKCRICGASGYSTTDDEFTEVDCE